ncbi:pyridoxal-phosphate dependent enzyme [bacterium]|nr:pyridoxal-phosphate dependent enzyme [bacterium]
MVRGRPVENPETVATAIRIGNPASRQGALRAREDSGGLFAAVSDAEILAAQRLLAQEEGIAVEPASAASVAGLIKLGRDGFFRQPAQVVAVVTGHGLKDPETAMAGSQPATVVPANVEPLAAALGL